uniref:Uncharacterized protein n=1 Tax=Zooxanthella nutricula TaxID=1333877 RepID=A0A7S2H836_9DINO
MLMKPLRVAVIFVEAALEVCLDRVARRAQLTGRPVQEDFVRRCNEGCVKSAYAVKDFVDLFVHIRNNGQMEFIEGHASDVRMFTMTAPALPKFPSRTGSMTTTATRLPSADSYSSPFNI